MWVKLQNGRRIVNLGSYTGFEAVSYAGGRFVIRLSMGFGTYDELSYSSLEDRDNDFEIISNGVVEKSWR